MLIRDFMAGIKNIFLIGNTGAMKTAVCNEIEKSDTYQILNFGEILRKAMLQDSPDAHVIRAYQFLGRISPFDVTSSAFKAAASEINFAKPFVISSFPLIPKEFHLLRNYSSRSILQNSIFYILNTSIEEVQKNLSRKYICNSCGSAFYLSDEQLATNSLKCPCGEELKEFNSSNYIKRHFFTSYVPLEDISTELEISGLEVKQIHLSQLSVKEFVKGFLNL